MDDDDIIKFWNLETSNLISTLNEDSQSKIFKKFKQIKDLKVIDNGAKLIARHKDGLAFWNLTTSLSNFHAQDLNMNYCSMVIDETGRHMWFDMQQLFYSKIELKQRPTPVKTIEFSRFRTKKQFLSSGDFLEIQRFRPSWKDLYSKTDKEGYRYRLVLVLIEKKRNSSTSNKEINHQNQLVEHIIYDSHISITSLSVVSTLGLSRPKVFENGKVRKKRSYISQIPNTDTHKVEVRFGNIVGNCFFTVLTFSNRSKSSKKVCFKVAAEWKTCLKNELQVEQSSQDDPRRTGSAIVFRDKEHHETETQSVERSPINDYKLFLGAKVDIEAFVYLENRKTKTKTVTFIRVFARQINESWNSCEHRLQFSVSVSKSSSFSLLEMDWFDDKDQKKTKFIRFAISGPLGLATFKFRYQQTTKNKNKEKTKVKNPLSMIKLIEQRVGINAKYLKSKDSFYLPSKCSILVYDGSLKFLNYTIDTETEVMSLYLIERKGEEKLIIYDRTHYYELDLNTLEFQRKISYRSEQDPSQLQLPFNVDLFEKGEVFSTLIFNSDIKEITFITKNKIIHPHLFPFSALLRCFNTKDYTEPVLEFSRYFFSQISQTNHEDFDFGPLNPLLFAIYHNDMDLLEQILEEYAYPKAVHHYWSPLAFALKFNYLTAVKVICDRLAGQQQSVSFNRQDFTYLLNSSKDYCHKLIANIPSKPAFKNLPKFVMMDSEMKLYFERGLDTFIYKIKKEENKIRSEALKNLQNINNKNKVLYNLMTKRNKLPTFEDLKITNRNKAFQDTKKAVVVFEVPFEYDYTVGSDDSIQFLYLYSETKTDELVNSKWKELVLFKWSQQYWFHLTFLVLYILFTVTLTISLVFFHKTKYLTKIQAQILKETKTRAQIQDQVQIIRYVEHIWLSFILLFMFYEMLQLVSYWIFKRSKYAF